MEIEAKFAVLDSVTLQSLRFMAELAGYTVGAGREKRYRDCYLDSPDRRLYAAGYALRRRYREDDVLMTLKGLGGGEGVIHRREEVELQLPQEMPLAAWPQHALRKRVEELVGDAGLQTLIELSQVRVVRSVRDQRRTVAELSIDEVWIPTLAHNEPFYEVEVELCADGAEADLEPIAAELQSTWGLTPVSDSKFERALAKSAASKNG